MISISGGASVATGPVSVGAGFGSAVTDENCVRFKAADRFMRYADESGDNRFRHAALYLLAQREETADALEFAGILRRPKKQAVVAGPKGGDHDPSAPGFMDPETAGD